MWTIFRLIWSFLFAPVQNQCHMSRGTNVVYFEPVKSIHANDGYWNLNNTQSQFGNSGSWQANKVRCLAAEDGVGDWQLLQPAVALDWELQVCLRNKKAEEEGNEQAVLLDCLLTYCWAKFYHMAEHMVRARWQKHGSLFPEPQIQANTKM